MPVMGVEPIRCHHQRILSPSRLPIPTHRRVFNFYIIPAPGQIVKCGGGFADKTLHFLAATPHFAMGITVLIARYLGEKKPEYIGPVIGGGTVVFALISAVLFVIMVALARPISVLMQAPAEAVELTAS